VRVDHEQEEVDARRAGDHRAHEALVTRHVDDRQLLPVGQLERRVAEVDRDAALALLREAVGVLARQRLDERRLAVVDVPGGADRQRHAANASEPTSVFPLLRPDCKRFDAWAGEILRTTTQLDEASPDLLADGVETLSKRERARISAWVPESMPLVWRRLTR